MLWVSLLIRFLPPLTSSGPPISQMAAGLAGGQGFMKVKEEGEDDVNGGHCESVFFSTLGRWGVFIGEGSTRSGRESRH
jgi:hypothetical protein